ncbi:MAG: putative cobaltochelatase [Chloroflexi bacterium]|nr:putative cobaltochelatase [Chloroflexota bacterium]
MGASAGGSAGGAPTHLPGDRRPARSAIRAGDRSTSVNVSSRPVFPFTAIVGQERFKRALILNAINPRIGGVLVRGEKGTAKSTAVRALANLLPEIQIVAGCPFGCDPGDPGGQCTDCQEHLGAGDELAVRTRRVPLVVLPVGATEDRVVGTLDLEHAIQHGRRRFEPGLLASANRGILYIDEVNLLNDHLVDVLLDAAAMGTNYVEREGISFHHPAQFILAGTMNPEEGELRPQLLDRFGLAAEVETLREPVDRAEVVRRRIAFEADPAAFLERWTPAEEAERERIYQARKLLPSVQVGDGMLALITALCAEFAVDGLRADIVMYKAAATLAAYAGRGRVVHDDIRKAAELTLAHRQRRKPFQEIGLDEDQIEEAIRRHGRGGSGEQGEPEAGGETATGQAATPSGAGKGTAPGQQAGGDHVFPVGDVTPVKKLTVESRRAYTRGRRSTARTGEGRGPYIRSTPLKPPSAALAFDATIRTAAPFQPARRLRQPVGPAILLESSDLQQKVREVEQGNLILLVVDASASMGAEQRMVAVKGVVQSLLLDAYRRRDQVGLVAFWRTDAKLLLPPTRSVQLAQQRLKTLPTGGRTPLAHGLVLARETLRAAYHRNRDLSPLLVLLTDGRPNVALADGDPFADAQEAAVQLRRQGVPSVVLDTESGRFKLGRARDIATAMDGRYFDLEDVAANGLAGTIRLALGRRSGMFRF